MLQACSCCLKNSETKDIGNTPVQEYSNFSADNNTMIFDLLVCSVSLEYFFLLDLASMARSSPFGAIPIPDVVYLVEQWERLLRCSRDPEGRPTVRRTVSRRYCAERPNALERIRCSIGVEAQAKIRLKNPVS